MGVHVDFAGSFHILHLVDEIRKIARHEIRWISLSTRLAVLARITGSAKGILGHVLSLGAVLILLGILGIRIIEILLNPGIAPFASPVVHRSHLLWVCPSIFNDVRIGRMFRHLP